MDFYNNDLLNILIVIGKANLLVLVLIFLSYIIEKTTGLRLLIDHYTWAKSIENTKVLATRDSGNYLIINVLFFAYHIYEETIRLNFINVAIWIILISILVRIFYLIHIKYQPFDPTKADDDFSG